MPREALLRVGAVALALTALSGPVRGEESGRFELGLFGGASVGSRISYTPSGDVRLGDGAAFGLRGAYRLNPHFTLEGSWSRTSVTARTTAPQVNGGTGPLLGTATVKSDVLELSGLYEWGRGTIRGYFGLGAGAMILDDGGGGLPNMGSRLSVNAAIGTKIRIVDGLDARLEAKYRWRTTPDRVSTVLCGEDPCKTYTTSFYSSAEITAGLSYRFGADPFRDVLEGTAPGGKAPSSGDKRFWEAAAGVALMEVLPWSVNRYVSDFEFAHISVETVRNNFRAGFGYDRDSFTTNQSSHPFHGSLFYNSARYNGYSFWESGIFAFVGSYVWEATLEREPPATNDLVNTTLGGMNRGEVLHRLATMLRDNMASGRTRFWREAGGAALDPMGFANRLYRGELARDFENPPDRDPKHFFLSGDAGYRHITGDVSSESQFVMTLNLEYGDPFRGELVKPFDSFALSLDVAYPGGAFLPRYQQRGILRGWELTDAAAPSRHVFAFVMDYEYVNNVAQVFGAQILGATLLSRYTLSPDLALRTDAAAGFFPLAGIGTTDVLNPVSGRTFDYAPGGGLRAGARLTWKGNEIASASYAIAWASTVDGSTTSNRLQSLRATGRWGLGKKLGVGAGWSWYERDSRYVNGAEAVRTQTEWRLFLSWRLL